jgi:signal transduction histidine kinase
MEATDDIARRVRQAFRLSLTARASSGVLSALLLLLLAAAMLPVATRLPLAGLAGLIALVLIGSSAPLASRSGALRRALLRVHSRPLLFIALVGACWGGAALALTLTPGPPGTRALLAAIWLAAAYLPMPLLVASRAAVVIWPATVLSPLALSCLAGGDAQSLQTGAVISLLLLLLIDSGLRQHARLRESKRGEADREELTQELQARALQDEKSIRDKTRFLATAAHDLRQPLHALGIFCAALEQRLEASAERPLVRSMRQSIEALERLFNAMLDVSRLDAGAVTPSHQVFPIREVFRRLYLHYAGDAEAKDVSLRFRAAGRLVKSDPQLLERLLSNLVSNALRYTQRGGVLVASRRAASGWVRIEVWDSGVGIPEDQLERVFEEFYQIDNPERDRSRGLGMGLPIVRRLCELLDHPLYVRSSVGRGSVFGITVPAAIEGVPAAAQLGADTLPPRIDQEIAVLLIDDERDIRDAMRELLMPRQVQLIEAATIAEAQAAARESFHIDLILSDLRLRDREDGICAVREIRRITGASTPAVLITGETSPEALREAQESGLVVMFKPLRPQDLLDLIERIAR